MSIFNARHASLLFSSLPVLVASLTSASAFAQSRDARDMDEIVVTASRSEKPLSTIPNTVTVINQKDLEQQISINSDMSTILGNMIPSFSPSRQKLTSYGETLRGRDPLYMVDGVPQSNPLRDGSRDGYTIDPLMLERVEVIHGANAIHGLGASGGIINMITKKPSKELQQSVRVESFGQTDSSETMGYGINYSVSGGGELLDVLASVSYRTTGTSYDANGEIIGFDNAQGDTMDTDMLNLFIKTGLDWDDQRIELTVNHFDIAGNNEWVGVEGDISEGIPTSAEKGEITGDAGTNEVTMLSVNYTNDEFLGHNLRTQVFSQKFAATYGGDYGTATFQDPAYGPNLFDQSQNNSEKQGVKLTLVKDELAGLPINLVYGTDFIQDKTYQKLIQTNRNWVPETNYQNIAFFLQAEYTGVENLTVTAGVRHEDSELDVDSFTTLYSYAGGQYVEGGNPEFSDTLYNIGATYKITDVWRIFGNYSEGFSMPDVGRVLRGINIPNQNVETFLDLEPIITENIEFGVEMNFDQLTAELSYYSSDADFGQRLQANADGIYQVQREKTEIDGIEFRLDWYATQQDTFGLRHAITEGEYDSNDDGKVDADLPSPNMSPNRINLSWERNWTNMINTRLQANHIFDRKFKNAAGVTTTEFEGYTTIDMNAELVSDIGTFQFSIQNLANEEYFTYYSQTLGNDNRNFTGLGRSFSVSYNLQF